jgi:hypothetical protein
METYLETYLESNKSFKLEGVSSTYVLQQGGKYGCILELDTPVGKMYAPIVLTKLRDQAIKELRKTLS